MSNYPLEIKNVGYVIHIMKLIFDHQKIRLLFRSKFNLAKVLK